MIDQEHPILSISGMIESMHGCEVCYKSFADSDLIAVDGIAYLKWQRVFPWYICRDCAEKISDALEEQGGQ